ncbi:MAG: DUF3109 family protein [Cytophagaceae bacterium]|jgi:Fe-S-cluster containining protein|nr:DUF3109 family protein [Cytophagaceae bacterium]
MVQIEDKVISLDIFTQRFTCDLLHCAGYCCVEGESGAPLEDDETVILENILPTIRPFLSESALKVIDKEGTWAVDFDGDKVTPLNNGRECVYAFYDGSICKCAIEKAYNKRLISFIKPLSCHLYPIRISKYKEFEALNYHAWHVCAPARELGKTTGIPLFRFLKEPIIRKYGEAFFKEMEEVEKAIDAITN